MCHSLHEDDRFEKIVGGLEKNNYSFVKENFDWNSPFFMSINFEIDFFLHTFFLNLR
jgi:hypothetical protein